MSNHLVQVVATLCGMAKTALPQRLQTIMDAMGWTQYTQLAKAAGASRQNVTNWMTELSGKKKNIEPRFAFNLQDATRFNARWIIYGDGPARNEIADPLDAKIVERLSKLSAERKRALMLALDLPV